MKDSNFPAVAGGSQATTEGGMSMRTRLMILGWILLVLGGLWFLQGINVVPGSFMTGSRFWAVIGAVVAIIGIWVLTGPARRQST